jgi:4-diphosphocytidyl-2-C-methyl-D-erythritol kinase
MPHPALTLTTGAKSNLFLRVIGRRPDGFHELESVFHTLDLVDDMELRPLDGGALEIEMVAAAGVGSPLPAPEDNIVIRAARVLQELTPPDEHGARPGARIWIRKRIPVGGGLGGGSSNAAGALLALDRLWELDLDRDALLGKAEALGSDVPYCLDGDGTALVGGRGENVARLPGPPAPLWFVLGMSDQPLLTAEVYAALGSSSPEGPPVAPFTLALGQGDVGELGQLLHNDLEAAALSLRPTLAEDKQALTDAGALGACVSGSGPTIFALAPDRDEAAAIAAMVGSRFDRVAVASSAARCVTFR